ncbi:glutathione S-transferase family protein [Chakrabartia godavariana]|nr:glutathione S-transferase family protein [Chakrabartia godavariana]
MPVLHHCAGARSFRCLWAAEEAGMDIDLKLWPFPPRVFAKQFKDINPLGTIPAWEENGHLLTESAAICQRIAAGSNLEVRPDEADYYPYLNWLHRSDATLTFPLTIVLRYTRLEPEERKLPQAVEDYKGFFMGRARSIEEALSDGRQWLVADRFTIADMCVGYAVHLSAGFGFDTELGPLTQAWYARLKDRPAFHRALAREK